MFFFLHFCECCFYSPCVLILALLFRKAWVKRTTDIPLIVVDKSMNVSCHTITVAFRPLWLLPHFFFLIRCVTELRILMWFVLGLNFYMFLCNNFFCFFPTVCHLILLWCYVYNDGHSVTWDWWSLFVSKHLYAE